MMTTKEKLISVQSVGLYYEQKQGLFRKKGELFWAIKDISFNLYQGEALGIIGRNGVGKSTLLKLLAGILSPDKGKIINYGYHCSLLSLQVGFIPYLTGRENAILSGMLLGLKRDEIQARMEEIISFSELGTFFEQPINTYSTGMIARLGFSVAFQIDPEILLIDEALGVGDADFKRKSTEVMHDKIRSDKTVVLVSHSVETIRDLCDRAIWVENGIIQTEGDTETVLSDYGNSLKNHQKKLTNALSSQAVK